MAIAKKGSRKIVVDGNEFIWKVRKYVNHNEHHGVDYCIPVQSVDGQILLITTGYNRSGSDYSANHQFPITPSIIQKCIRYAISKGWQYKEKRPPFEIDCTSIIMEQACLNTELFIKEVEKDDKEISKKIAADATDLINVGEYKIALEDIVSNVCEFNISLDIKAISLAEQALSIWKNDKYLKILSNVRLKK